MVGVQNLTVKQDGVDIPHKLYYLVARQGLFDKPTLLANSVIVSRPSVDSIDSIFVSNLSNSLLNDIFDIIIPFN